LVPKIRLGELLIREGRLTDDQLQQALARQKQTGRRLGAVLQDLGFVTDDVIARLLAAQLKFPYFDRFRLVDRRRRLSELQVRKPRALPVGVTGERVRVAGSTRPTGSRRRTAALRLAHRHRGHP
jgi:MSHA biogenesis protein MshE